MFKPDNDLLDRYKFMANDQDFRLAEEGYQLRDESWRFDMRHFRLNKTGDGFPHGLEDEDD